MKREENSSSALSASREQLLDNLKKVVSDAEDLLREVGRSTATEFSGVRGKFDDGVHQARMRLHDAQAAAAGTARMAADTSRQYAREHPWQVVVVGAIVAGLIIGALSRRH